MACWWWASACAMRIRQRVHFGFSHIKNRCVVRKKKFNCDRYCFVCWSQVRSCRWCDSHYFRTKRIATNTKVSIERHTHTPRTYRARKNFNICSFCQLIIIIMPRSFFSFGSGATNFQRLDTRRNEKFILRAHEHRDTSIHIHFYCS